MEGESTRHLAFREVTRAREAAERKRLIYVALTRARDLLVLGLRKGNKGRNDPQSFAVLLDAPIATPAASAFVEEIDVDALPVARPHPPQPPSSTAQARVDAAIARARAPAPLAPVALLPVTHLQDFVACPRKYHYAHQVGLSETPTRVDFTEGEEAQSPDPRAQGIAAHRLLECTALDAVGTAELEPSLVSLAAEEALEAPRSVIDHVLAFWETDFGKQVARGGDAQLFRELPFALELGKPGEQRLVLRGQIDLLHLDADNTAWVLDYKTTMRAPAGLEPYRFQLSAYAIAARKFAPTARAVKTGIAYLRDRPVGVEWDSPSPGALDSLEASLQNETRALLAAQRDGKWEGRPVERCRAIKCGYISRCHPSKS
jgi:ATP-dependent exoDNAse (exonuclease V) beta subunit